ncbi:hypothetical protein BJX63DRAFT_274564 [Aspergillus granulosus]|uniref:Secreted protein n=1 Tax=Aspergillus granulosus TaxID=176169 RepID=A0ABR4H820_9EURO
MVHASSSRLIVASVGLCLYLFQSLCQASREKGNVVGTGALKMVTMDRDRPGEGMIRQIPPKPTPETGFPCLFLPLTARAGCLAVTTHHSYAPSYVPPLALTSAKHQPFLSAFCLLSSVNSDRSHLYSVLTQKPPASHCACETATVFSWRQLPDLLSPNILSHSVRRRW